MILITGATGNNGQELVRQLSKMGQRVRALARKPAEAVKFNESNIEVVAGDFEQPETLEAALRGVEKAFLLTPVTERFVQWQNDFIEAARRAKVFTRSGHEGVTYVITGPEALTFQQAAEKLSYVLGRKIQYVDVPISAAADGMRKSGMPDWNVHAVSDLLAYFATGAAATVTDTVPRLLGRPATSFEQFVKDHRAVFMKRIVLSDKKRRLHESRFQLIHDCICVAVAIECCLLLALRPLPAH
jgi:uncharacterized protein YbjT (DUF2867 family)